MSFEQKPTNPLTTDLPSNPDSLPPTLYQNNPIYSKHPNSHSPSYRSPTLSTLLQSNSSHPQCATCKKRSNPSNPKIFHNSPPKIRPSHHSIVCDDCSQGSYSKILKVICLNEPQSFTTETKKLRIIENSPNPQIAKSFPLTGSGSTVKVVYEEVLLPPKTELTSVITDLDQDDFLAVFNAKEEERKRVVIRRAEYANRVKGVTQTVETTFVKGEETKRVLRQSSLEFEVIGRNSERKVLKSEGKRNEGGSVERGRGRIREDNGSHHEKREKKTKGKIESHHQSREKRIKKEIGSRDKSKDKRMKEEIGCLDKNKEKGMEEVIGTRDKSREKRMKEVRQVREDSIKRNLEQSKACVKNKILAKLAEKDFELFLDKTKKEKKEVGEEKLLTSENSVICESFDSHEQGVKVGDSFDIFEGIDKSKDIEEQKTFEGISEELNESLKFSLRIDKKDCVRIEEASEKNEDSRGKSEEFRGSYRKDKAEDGERSPNSEEMIEIFEASPKTVEKCSGSIEKSPCTVVKNSRRAEKSPKTIVKYIETTEKNPVPENLSECIEKSPITAIKHSETDEISPQSINSYENIKKSPKPSSESSESLKDHSKPSPVHPEPSSESSSSEKLEFCSVSIEESIKSSPRHSSPIQEPNTESYEVLKKQLNYVGNPFEDSPSGQNLAFNDSPELENISIDLTNQLTFENIRMSDLEQNRQSELIIYTGMDQESLNVAEESKNVEIEEEVGVKNDEFFEGEEKKLEEDRKELGYGVESVLSTLADPMVIKGLRLLGGFADYLEKFGGNILDLK